MLLGLFLFASSCEKAGKPEAEEQLMDLFSQLPLSQSGHLLDVFPLDEDIDLPIGTKISQRPNELGAVGFELPKTHLFITVNSMTGESGTSNYGGYSCSCTGGSGGCAVISAAGRFGCLHENCSGDCIGSKTRGGSQLSGGENIIVGVISKTDELLKATPSEFKATLGQQGIDAFFKLKEVARQIEEHYTFAYNQFPKVDMEKLPVDADAPSGHLFLPVNLYGVDFMMLIPESENDSELFPEYQLAKSGRPSCDGDNGCSCSLTRQCILGNCVWICKGCKTCRMGDPNE